jgi:dihydroneopterin aldolase / 2-amino-4-hydroxy-6-hydroxymethyldihydropteridine diphosphokinase
LGTSPFISQAFYQMPHITAYIGIGSNLGIPEKNCTNAIEKISSIKDIKIISKSSFYQTEPIGGVQQGWFINAAIEIKTDLSPENLLSVLLNLELVMGRIRQEKWGPRLIDLDLLLYSNLVLEKKGLTLPHPEIQNRKFVLIPMSEIAGNVIHPTLKKTIKTLLQESSDVTIVKKTKKSNPIHRDQSFPQNSKHST